LFVCSSVWQEIGVRFRFGNGQVRYEVCENLRMERERGRYRLGRATGDVLAAGQRFVCDAEN